MSTTSNTGEDFFRDLCENALDMIQCVLPDGRFLYVNDTWLETLGYDRDELAGLNILDVVHPGCRESCGEAFRRVLAGEPLERYETVFVIAGSQRLSCC